MNFKKFMIFLFLSLGLLFLVAFSSLFFGSVEFSYSDFLSIFRENPTKNAQIILLLRFPRILSAIAVGGGLAVAGSVLQVILKNPLAEPYILGISSGGTFGALISFWLGLSFAFTQFFSFIGAMIIILLLFLISSKNHLRTPTNFLLFGVMIGAFFGSSILIILLLMKENLQTAIFWLVGTLSFINSEKTYFVMIFSFSLSAIIFLGSFKLNLLASNDEHIRTLGINKNRLENIFIILTTVLVGGLVSVSGVIGFVGMIIPHIVRIFVGYDNRYVIPMSFIWGGILLLIADSFARTIILPSELPVGAITAIFGAPIFIYLLRKNFNLIN